MRSEKLVSISNIPFMNREERADESIQLMKVWTDD
jgi:hypothetical protein